VHTVRFVLSIRDLGALGDHSHQEQLVYMVEEVWPWWDKEISASMMTLRVIELALYIP